jgi:hypothetical protein
MSSVASDADGNIIVAGNFTGSLKFGATTLISAGGTDYFVAKFNKKGTTLWAKQFGNAADNGAKARIAIDLQSNIIIGGELTGGANFGGGTITSAGSSDILIVKLDPDGNHKWSKIFGDVSNQTATCVSVDPQGDIILGGSFSGTLNLGGAAFVSTGGPPDAFLAKLTSATGAHVWSKQFSDVAGQPKGPQAIKDIAVDSAGNIVALGQFFQSANFGGAPFLSVLNNAVLAKYDNTGNHSWSQAYSSTSDLFATSIATNSAGHAIATGTFKGTIKFGDSDLVAQGAFDNTFIVDLDASGTHKWSKSFGAATQTSVYAMAVDASGSAIITGTTGGNVTFGGAALVDPGAFLAKLDASGTYLWSKNFLGAFGYVLATDPLSSAVILGGNAKGTVDFGAGALMSAGGGSANSIFLAKFQP